MSVLIQSVEKKSKAYRAGLRDGDILVSINGNSIEDILDYRFYITEKKVKIGYERNGKNRFALILKQEYDDIGLGFSTYLMDKHHRCRNNCIFCFVDQMPKGMRESLYFKDDDERLSFLFGNYITLTCLSEREVERIIKMHISPINISVHTTNPELRVKMMGNRFAGDALEILNRFSEAGIKMNCQIVLCPGINDGDELKRSVSDLSALYPAVESIAVVPVGLTKFRDGLYPLRPFCKASSGAVIDMLHKMGDDNLQRFGKRLVFPSDEFYLKAERPLPDEVFFEDFAQLDNGVGMLTLFTSQFHGEMEHLTEESINHNIHFAVATGKAAAGMFEKLIDEARKKWHNLECDLYVIENEFFGENITVAGLITAKDLIGQLKGKLNCDKLLISDVMLRKNENVFLDDLSLEDVSRELNVEIISMDCEGGTFLDMLIYGD